MIKVSDYLIKILKKAGVEVFFGVQGGAIAHLIESSSKAAEYIPVLNEQSAGLSAHGYYFDFHMKLKQKKVEKYIS